MMFPAIYLNPSKYTNIIYLIHSTCLPKYLALPPPPKSTSTDSCVLRLESSMPFKIINNTKNFSTGCKAGNKWPRRLPARWHPRRNSGTTSPRPPTASWLFSTIQFSPEIMKPRWRKSSSERNSHRYKIFIIYTLIKWLVKWVWTMYVICLSL